MSEGVLQVSSLSREGSSGELDGETRGGRGETIHVDAEKGDDTDGDGSDGNPYRTIQKGVDEATDGNGDEIVVHPGNYTEFIDVDKDVTIRSSSGNSNDTNVTGPDWTDWVFHVTADWVNISGLRITGTSGGFMGGIHLDTVSHCNISGNNITKNAHGIQFTDVTDSSTYGNIIRESSQDGLHVKRGSENIFGSNIIVDNPTGVYIFTASETTFSDNEVTSCYYGMNLKTLTGSSLVEGNTIRESTGYGLQFDDCTGVVVEGNTLRDNMQYGLFIQSSEKLILGNNTMNDNLHEFGIGGFEKPDYEHTIFSTNTVHGDPIIYWTDQSERSVPMEAGFVGLVGCSNITVEDLYLWGNSHGILLVDSVDCTIQDNGIDYAKVSGIRLDYRSDRNIVDGNELLENDFMNEGITVDTSHGNRISNNTVKKYYYGINLESAQETIISDNTANENRYGIYLLGSSGCDVRGNYAGWNAYSGYYLTDSDENELSGNTAHNNGQYGLALSRSSDNDIQLNEATENQLYDIFLFYYRAFSEGYTGNIIENNSGSNGEPILFYDRQVDISGESACEIILFDADGSNLSDITIDGSVERKNNGLLVIGTDDATFTNIDSSGNENGAIFSYSTGNAIDSSSFDGNEDYGFVFWEDCTNNDIEDSSADTNGNDGFFLNSGSSENSLVKNTARDNNRRGFALWSQSNENVIDGCNASGNSWHGLGLGLANENSIVNCIITENTDHGIDIQNSNNNLIYNNMFNNTKNARDSGNNDWNIDPSRGKNIIDGPYLGGNFWSDYSGNDTDGDSLGDEDTPYTSNGEIQNGGDSHPLLPPSPVLEVIKTADVERVRSGETINYTITIRNTVAVNVTNITITEFYGINLQYVSSDPEPIEGDDTWGNYSLGVNETMNITVTVRTAERLPNGSTIRNEVEVSCEEGSDVTAFAETEIKAPVFSVNITDDPDPVQEGTTTNLTVRVTNVGETHATDVRLSATYHGKMTFVGSGPDPVSGNNVWEIGSLEPGENGTITVTLEVSTTARDRNVFTNRFQVTCDEGSTAEESEQTTISGPSLINWKLGVIEEEPTDYILNYTFEIINSGTGYASNITIVETYDPWTTYLSSDLPPDERNDTWYIPRVESGETFRFNLSVSVNGSISNATWIENRALLSWFEGYSSNLKSGTLFIVDEPPVVERNITIIIDPVPKPIPDPSENFTLHLSGNITITQNGMVNSLDFLLDDIPIRNVVWENQTNDTSILPFMANITLPGNLTEGNHTIKVNVTLATGEWNETSVNFTFEREPIVRELIIEWDDINESNITAKKIDFGGKFVVLPNGSVKSVDFYHADFSGAWYSSNLTTQVFSANVRFRNPLQEGNHSIMIEVTLKTGEVFTENLTFHYTPPPVHEIIITIDPIEDKIAPEAFIQITGLITVEPNADVQDVTVRLDDGQAGHAVFSNDNFSMRVWLPMDLLPGEHVIRVTVSLSGGESNATATTFTIKEEESGGGDEGNNKLLVVGFLLLLLVIIVAVILLRPDSEKRPEERKEDTPTPGKVSEKKPTSGNMKEKKQKEEKTNHKEDGQVASREKKGEDPSEKEHEANTTEKKEGNRGEEKDDEKIAN